MRVVAVTGIEPSVCMRLVGLADLGDQMAAEFVPGAQSQLAHPHRNCKGARLPRSAERTPGVQRGTRKQFGDCVGRAHRRPPARGGSIFAVPTIESRVTSPVSCSSFILPVPAGRSGITM